MEVLDLKYAVNTFFLLFSGALVMWMAAGFSMLEAGLVRSKNTIEILTKNLALYAIACLVYFCFGYQIMYGDSLNAYWPSFYWLIGAEHVYDDLVANSEDITYSKLADFFFQVVFVATSVSVVSGAVAERMRLFSFLFFAVVMSLFIYPVQGYWHWGGGFLNKMGFIDFAGSGVVHLTGAVAALTGAFWVGARKGKYIGGAIHPIPGANLPLATLGMFILWFGWFGFNGGSQLAVASFGDANAVAKIFVNTNMAAAAGVIGALLTARAVFGKADLTMVINGALAGLVAITAEPLAAAVYESVMIGFIAGILVVLAIVFWDKRHIDDPVGAISVHGVCGIWGLLAVTWTNPEAVFWVQLTGVVVIFSWVFVTSCMAWFFINKLMGLRVSDEEEYYGLDATDCGLEAYPEFTSSRQP